MQLPGEVCAGLAPRGLGEVLKLLWRVPGVLPVPGDFHSSLHISHAYIRELCVAVLGTRATVTIPQGAGRGSEASQRGAQIVACTR